MRKLKNPMLKSLYETYGIDYERLEQSVDAKNRIRTKANRTLKKEFGSRNWNSLTFNEKNYFILHLMKDYMMNEIAEVIYPCNSSKVKGIRIAIEKLIKEQYVSVNESIKKANVNIENLYTKDDTGHNKYGDLQDKLLELYKSGEGTGDSKSTVNDIRFSILETKINVLLEVIQEKLGVQIDTEAIEDCCKYLIKNDLNNDDIIQLDIDEQSSVPVEVQEKIIEANQRYFAYMLQKENLEFYKDKEQI
ncbi:hypothetical protein [Streptococcus plurextorum]|uniref:hypothetical protein n=1 Tax=Streptococcus plurextorum TaxID=456876 RepID=UPI00041C16C9|nr:hypothetical protein [Streptococcus plurextorum]